MKLSLGFSPCPNDTFLFDAMVHHKVDTRGLTFDTHLEDVEALNQAARRGAYDITKLSYHAYAHLTESYVMLQSGSALGKGCGPLLIARRPLGELEIRRAKVGMPGALTTACFLFRLAYPEHQREEHMVFSEIEQAVLEGAVDAGVIIHENRFTYRQKGLVECMDLGAFWEETTGLPIPLGGIAVRRDLPAEVKTRIQTVLRESVAFARQHPAHSYAYVRDHAQEMDRHVMFQHIDLYVNDFTEQLGRAGRRAVEVLFDRASELDLIPDPHLPLFVEKEQSPSRSC